MNEIEILEQYLKNTDLTIKELYDRNVLSQIVQAMMAFKNEAGQHDTIVSGLKGEVVKIGEMYVDDELLTGMFVEISREEFLEQDTNYLYQKVKIKKEAH